MACGPPKVMKNDPIPKKEHLHRDLSTALRFGRDDKGEGGASGEGSCWVCFFERAPSHAGWR
jgi:hypothetical protein